MKGQQGPPGPQSRGVTYVSWGRTTCPDTEGTEVVYTGRAAGSHFSHSGGGSNYLCVTGEPENLDFNLTSVLTSYLYGARYVLPGNLPLHNHNVPCTVCYVSTRETVLMIPGKYTCPENWTREYYGYLMAERYNHQRSTFECMDVTPETVFGEQIYYGALFLSCGATRLAFLRNI